MCCCTMICVCRPPYSLRCITKTYSILLNQLELVNFKTFRGVWLKNITHLVRSKVIGRNLFFYLLLTDILSLSINFSWALTRSTQFKNIGVKRGVLKGEIWTLQNISLGLFWLEWHNSNVLMCLWKSFWKRITHQLFASFKLVFVEVFFK